MSCVRQPYSGRLIFDHFPKTAGQAINAWLRDALGDGTVSPNLIGSHRELLRASGEYPVVSGHVLFAEGEGLDPRFQYATLLREPVDRTISWLYFVIRNHRPSAVAELYGPCMAFLDSEGEILPEILQGHLLNTAVRHYSAITVPQIHGAVDLVEAAFHSIAKYDCVGVYERLNDFVADLAALIGVPAPAGLQTVNVTKERPAAIEISHKLRKNILKITELDRSLYKKVSALIDDRLAQGDRHEPPAESRWEPYRLPKPREISSPALTLHKVRALHSEPVHSGAILQFQLDFELHEPAEMLEAGLHILDDRKRWSFGVNNMLLNQPFPNLRPGKYRIIHYVKANLPAGDYSIGFAFADVEGSSQKSLYWHDGLLPIHVRRPPAKPGVGVTACETRMMLVQWGQVFPLHNPRPANNSNDPQVAA